GSLHTVGLGHYSATFNPLKAVMKTIGLTAAGLPLDLATGDTLTLRLWVRIAATGTTHTNATASLWFNIPSATAENSHFHGTINNGPEFAYFLTGSASDPATFVVKKDNVGVGPTQSIDVFVDKNV